MNILKFKSFVYIIFCLCFIVLCVCACSTGNLPSDGTSTTADHEVLKSNRNLAKIVITQYDGVGNVHTVQSEEDFHEHLDAYIEGQKKEENNVLCMSVYYEKENVLTNEELAHIKYSYYKRSKIENAMPHGEMVIFIDIPFEDVNREDIMNLTANEKITGIYFKYNYKPVIG